MKTRLFALAILLMITTPAFADRDRDHYRPYNHHASKYQKQTNYFYQNQRDNYIYENKYHRHYHNDNGYYDRNYYVRPTHPRYYNDVVGVLFWVGILEVDK